MKKSSASALRTAAILFFLVVVAVGYFAGIGIGNLSGFGWDAFSVLCPVGYLESLVASKVFVPRAFLSFVAVVVLVIVLGRVFCAWACPVPLWQRLAGSRPLPTRRKHRRSGNAPADGAACEERGASCSSCASPCAQIGGKPNRFKFDSRFGVLLGAIGSAAIFGFPVFCLVCPVGLTFATVFLVMRLFGFGDVTWGVVLVPALLIVEVVFLRKWCSRLCPIGAVLSLVSGANRTLRPTIDNEKCLVTAKNADCHICADVCPESLDIRRPATSPEPLSNCTKCRECAQACPTRAITYPLLPKRDDDPCEQGGAS